MEECDILCERLAILVNGQFRCCGNLPYLKRKFTEGFSVVVKYDETANESSIEAIKDVMSKTFDECILRDSHLVCIYYCLNLL